MQLVFRAGTVDVVPPRTFAASECAADGLVQPGGGILQADEIPEAGSSALSKDPDGNLFGLFKA